MILAIHEEYLDSLEYFPVKGENSTMLRNVGDHSLNDTASQAKDCSLQCQ